MGGWGFWQCTAWESGCVFGERCESFLIRSGGGFLLRALVLAGMVAVVLWAAMGFWGHSGWWVLADSAALAK